MFSFYLLNTSTICVIFLYNCMHCIDGLSILLQGYVRKGITMQRTQQFSGFVCYRKNPVKDVRANCFCASLRLGPGKRGHIVADTTVSLFARARNICCGHNFVSGTKIVSDFVQKHFVSATNVSQFAQPRKHHEQQCVRNNVSSFACTFTAHADSHATSCIDRAR